MNTKTLRTMLQSLKNGEVNTAFNAEELVRSTLARHGLAGPIGSAPGLGGAARSAAARTLRGAHPKRQRFDCASGSRDYMVHLPDATKPPRGLVLMLHGCTQTPEDFSIGTGFNAHAEAAGLVVVWPAQSRGDNAQSCWNWFSGADQRRGRGEPAILAGLAQHVAKQHGVPDTAIFAAGLSAGAAMAVILGQAYPDVFSAVGAHSGLPYGSARGVNEAFAAMAGQGGRSNDTTCPLRTITFHGSVDLTVASSNSMQIHKDAVGARTNATEIIDEGSTNGRRFRRTSSLGSDGTALAELWQIEGLAHSWSGGNPQGSYADPKGPDASAEMLRFFMDSIKQG